MPRTKLASCAILGLVLASATSAHASSPSDARLAEALFQEGKRLMAEKKFTEGCPKLAESQRLDPGGGTLLALALCHESEGKTATAWAELNEALAWASRDGRPEREQLARKHLVAIEPKVSHLNLTAPSASDAPGFTVTLDGTALDKAALGTPLPVDPGKHTVLASAPARSPWSMTVDVGEAMNTSVVVPPLAREQGTSAAQPAAAAAGGKAWPFIAGGVGVAGVALGSTFGLMAISKRRQSDDRCTPKCSHEAVSLNDQAKSDAMVSTVAFGVGVLGIAGATYLWFSSSRDAPAANQKIARVDALVSRGELSVSVSGAW